MTYIIIVLAILAVFGAIIFFHYLSNKDKEFKKSQRQAKQYTIRADDTWDTAEKITEFIQAPDIVDALMDYFCDLIQRREQIYPMDDTQQLLQDAQSFKEQFKNRSPKNELTSDKEINSAKRTFTKTSKILRAALNKKLLAGQSYLNMRRTMKMRILTLEVQCHENLGTAAAERNDPAIATNHFKYAKKLLIESDLKFEGKNEWVRDITNKNQAMFGNVVADRLGKGLEDEDPGARDEHGIPKDLDAMAGKRKY